MQKMTNNYQKHQFLDETGRILNEKMMPRRHPNGPGARNPKNKKHTNHNKTNTKTSDINMSTKKLADLATTNPPIPDCCLRNFRGQAPTWSCLERLPSCSTSNTSSTSSASNTSSTGSTSIGALYLLVRH
jgi:hypothetical protein